MSAPRKFRETLSLAYRRVNALQRGEKRCFGVTISQCVTLELLLQQGPMTVCDLARNLGLDTSTVTRVVDVLARDGMTRRARDEEQDRRRVFVSLTAKGRALAAKLERCADDYSERILKRIPAEMREDVIHTLRVLIEAIDDLPETCS
jgi:DNA-binding MarR family transcriptional regulator